MLNNLASMFHFKHLLRVIWHVTDTRLLSYTLLAPLENIHSFQGVGALLGGGGLIQEECQSRVTQLDTGYKYLYYLGKIYLDNSQNSLDLKSLKKSENIVNIMHFPKSRTE